MLPTAVSPAALDLGLGGQLQQQHTETEEERKRRLAQLASQQGSALGNPLRSATDTLFGL